MSFSISPIAIVEILGISQCLFFSVCVYLARKRNPANLILAAFMFAYAVYLLDAFFSTTSFPVIEDMLWPVDFLLPPLFYLYIIALISPAPFQFAPRHLVHLISFGVALLLIAPYLSLSWPLRDVVPDFELNYQAMVDEVVTSDAELAPMADRLANAAIGVELFINLYLIQTTFYLVLTLLAFGKHWRALKTVYSSMGHTKLPWLYFLAGFQFFIWMCFGLWDFIDHYVIEIEDKVELVTSVAQLAGIYAIGIVGLRQPVVNDLACARVLAELSRPGPGAASPDKSRPNPQKYARSALEEPDVQRILVKLDHLMLRERLFLQNTLTLPDVAAKSGISANYISQAINQQLGENFFDFVNSYRVEDAKDRIRHSDDTILNIALAAGFNSKSTFNAAFKKITGQTPSQFRRAGDTPKRKSRSATDGQRSAPLSTPSATVGS